MADTIIGHDGYFALLQLFYIRTFAPEVEILESLFDPGTQRIF